MYENLLRKNVSSRYLRMIGVVLVGSAGLIGCSLFPSAGVESKERVFYVSPKGDDQNAGTKRKPFATLRHARDVARTLRQTRPLAVTVRLLSGTYFLNEPLALTPADSGTTYEAAPGARPVVSGGARVTGWHRQSDQLWVADVPWLKGRSEPFTQLFVNGVRRSCARTPNEGAYFYTKLARRKSGDKGCGNTIYELEG